MVNDTQANLFWWQRRWFLVLVVAASLIPLLWPAVPPLVDLPGHMGRYAVQLDPQSPALSHWYAFHWRLIGNIGVDLLVIPMAKIFGLELGVKLIVLCIPAMTTAGLLWIAHEAHGRLPPTVLFALPLAYGHPFLFGFVNFSLGVSLTLLTFALWLRMTRAGLTRWRPLVFSVLASMIWVAHTFAWGILGLLCFSAEVVRLRDLRRGLSASLVSAALACLPMALPLIPMLAWRSQATDVASDWFNWAAKAGYVTMTLRDRWITFDHWALIIVFLVAVMPLVVKSLSYSRNLVASTITLTLVFILLPRIVFGSAYADMRMTPLLFAMPLIAIRVRTDADKSLLNVLAIAGLCFFALRIAAATASLFMASARYDQALAALDHVPRYSRLVTFTRRSCDLEWWTGHMEHLAGLAIVRRQAFANDQWEVSGANLMTIVKNDAPGFTTDPSQLVTQTQCRAGAWSTIDRALRALPRSAFDYVWLIDPPRYDAHLTDGMTLVWASGLDRLYRIDRK